PIPGLATAFGEKVWRLGSPLRGKKQQGSIYDGSRQMPLSPRTRTNGKPGHAKVFPPVTMRNSAMPIPGLATAFGEKVWRLGNRSASRAVVEARSQRNSPDVGPLSTTLAALPLP